MSYFITEKFCKDTIKAEMERAIGKNNICKVKRIISQVGLNYCDTWDERFWLLIDALSLGSKDCAEEIWKATDAQFKNSFEIHWLCGAMEFISEAMLNDIMNRNLKTVNLRDKSFQVLLYCAIFAERGEFIPTLLSYGIPFDIFDKGENLLHHAIAGSNVNAVKYLLDAGANIHLEVQGRKLIHTAFCGGNMEIINLLFDKGADATGKDEDGNTILHLLCKLPFQSISEEEIQSLIHKFAQDINVNATNNDGKSPLFYAVLCGFLTRVKTLLTHDINLNEDGNKRVFIECLKHSSNEQNVLILNTLQEYGFAFSTEDAQNQEILCDIITNGYTDILKQMLDLGADLDAVVPIDHYAKTAEHMTLLQIAIKFEQLECLKLLLSSGADPNKLGDKEFWSPLMFAVDIQSKLEIIEELVHYGANLHDVSINGFSVLHLATLRGNEDMVQYLLSQNIDVNCRMHNGATSLHCAAIFGGCQIMSILIEHGCIVNATMEKMLTPLHLAVMSENLETPLFLMDHGADIYARDSWGRTPLGMALTQRSPLIVSALLLRGADLVVLKDARTSINDGSVDEICKAFNMPAHCTSQLSEQISELTVDDTFIDYKEGDEVCFTFNSIGRVFERYSKWIETRMRILELPMEEVEALINNETSKPVHIKLASEVMLLRKTEIVDGVTLYDFLLRNHKDLAGYFGTKIEADEKLSQFTCLGYYNLLKKRVDDIERYNLESLAANTLCKVLENKLPLDMTLQVCSFLSKYDLKVCLNAFTGFVLYQEINVVKTAVEFVSMQNYDYYDSDEYIEQPSNSKVHRERESFMKRICEIWEENRTDLLSILQLSSNYSISCNKPL